MLGLDTYLWADIQIRMQRLYDMIRQIEDRKSAMNLIIVYYGGYFHLIGDRS